MFKSKPSFYMIGKIMTLSVAFVLSACGGGGGGSDPKPETPKSQLTGIAAVGLPIVNGTVLVKCSSGYNTTATTNITGNWETTIPNDAYPCAVRVQGGTVDGVPVTSALHSIIQDAGNVNVTPLTDLILANVLGQSPESWFNDATNSQLSGSLTSTNVANAIQAVINVLATLPGQPTIPEGFDPIKTPFAANQVDSGDVLLENYAIGLASAGLTREEATRIVAAGGAALTEEANALAIFSPSADGGDLIKFQGGYTKQEGVLILSVPDARYTPRIATVNQRDDAGNIINFNEGEVFNRYLSLFGNRVGQLCIEGLGGSDYDDGYRASYVYVSQDLVEVTDETEIAGKVFKQYAGCAFRGVTFEYLPGDVYSFTFTDTSDPESPFYNVPQTSTGSGTYQSYEDDYQGTFVTKKKIYKYVDNGVTKYVFIHNNPHSVVVGVSE